MNHGRANGSLQGPAVVAILVVFVMIQVVIATVSSTSRKIRNQAAVDATVSSAASVQALALDVNAVVNDAVLALHGIEALVLMVGAIDGLAKVASTRQMPEGIRTVGEALDLAKELFKSNQDIAAFRDDLNRYIFPAGTLLTMQAASLADQSGATIPYPTGRDDFGDPEPRDNADSGGPSCVDSITGSGRAELPQPDTPSRNLPPAALAIQAVPIDSAHLLGAMLFKMIRGPIDDGTGQVSSKLQERLDLDAAIQSWLGRLEEQVEDSIQTAIDETIGKLPDFSSPSVDRQIDYLCDLTPQVISDIDGGSFPDRTWQRELSRLQQDIGLDAELGDALDGNRLETALSQSVLGSLDIDLGSGSVLSAMSALDAGSDAVNQMKSGIRRQIAAVAGNSWETLAADEVNWRLGQSRNYISAKWIRGVAILGPDQQERSKAEAADMLCGRLRGFGKSLATLEQDIRASIESAVAAAISVAISKVTLFSEQLKLEAADAVGDAQARAMSKMDEWAARIICASVGDKGLNNLVDGDFPMPTVMTPDFYDRQVLAAARVSGFGSRDIGISTAQAQPVASRRSQQPGFPILVPGFTTRLIPVDFPERVPELPSQIKGFARDALQH